MCKNKKPEIEIKAFHDHKEHCQIYKITIYDHFFETVPPEKLAAFQKLNRIRQAEDNVIYQTLKYFSRLADLTKHSDVVEHIYHRETSNTMSSNMTP